MMGIHHLWRGTPPYYYAGVDECGVSITYIYIYIYTYARVCVYIYMYVYYHYLFPSFIIGIHDDAVLVVISSTGLSPGGVRHVWFPIGILLPSNGAHKKVTTIF